MKNVTITLFALCCFPALALAQEEQSEESGYYSFMGAEILTRLKGQMSPVIWADEKGFYVRKGKKGQKRMNWSTPCSAQPVFSISDKFVSIEDLNYQFFYRKDAYQEEAAYRDMNTRNRETQHKIGMLQGTGSQQEIEELIDEQENFEENMEELIEDDKLKQTGYADSIELKMKLRPNRDIHDAYLAVMASHQNMDGKLRVAVKVEWIGDLLKDIPEEVAISKLLVEGDYQSSRIELFLFAGDASPIPTNLSRGLKELSRRDLEDTLKTQGVALPQKSAAQ